VAKGEFAGWPRCFAREANLWLEISRRIREGMKVVLEEVLGKEMTEHLAAGYRERTPGRRGVRTGRYTRSLITPVGKVKQLRVPRNCEGNFLTEVFECYKRLTPKT